MRILNYPRIIEFAKMVLGGIIGVGQAMFCVFAIPLLIAAAYVMIAS